MNFGSYVIVAEIGSGGAGVVYRARDAEGRTVAIKMLMRAGPGECIRFEREQRLLGALGEDEGFVPLLAAGEQPRPHLVMPFLEGGTLRDRMRRGPMPIAEAVALGARLARALGRAHAKGIVHRDVKPENILFTASGAPLIADLGLAKHFSLDDESAHASVALSRSNELRGTVGYMPKEQIRSARDVKAPADVFALGALLYECVAGEPPFSAGTVIELLARVETGHFTRLERHRPDAPPALVATIHRALAFEPEDRFADGEQMARALERLDSRRSLDGTGSRWWLLLVFPLSLIAVLVLVTPPRAHEEEAPVMPKAPPPAAPVASSASGSTPDARAHLAQGIELATRKPPELAAAQEQLDAAVRLAPELAEVWAARGWLNERRNRNEDAIRDCTKAIELDPRDASSFANRGTARFKLKEYDDAIVDLTRAIELDEKSVSAWATRARAREKKRDWKGALADAERVCELVPDNEGLRTLRDRLRKRN